MVWEWESVCGVGGGVVACSTTPPTARTASYTFTKHPLYKGATYTGTDAGLFVVVVVVICGGCL